MDLPFVGESVDSFVSEFFSIAATLMVGQYQPRTNHES